MTRHSSTHAPPLIPSCLLSHRRTWGPVGRNIAEKWATTAELQHFWLWEPTEATRGATHCMMPKQLTFCTGLRIAAPPAIISYIKDNQIIWLLLWLLLVPKFKWLLNKRIFSYCVVVAVKCSLLNLCLYIRFFIPLINLQKCCVKFPKTLGASQGCFEWL